MPETRLSKRITRRRFLLGAGAALMAAGATNGCSRIGLGLKKETPRASGPRVPTRGVTLDRQYLTLPNVPVFDKYDIRQIKSMGFEHVKLLVNPEPHKSGNGINEASMGYIDSIIGLVLDEGLPLVLCIHPEIPFKRKILGSREEFEHMLGFYEKFARYLAKRTDPDQLVFQLMTEPTGNRWDWNVMQRKMWMAARAGLPDHTLVLGGNQYAYIEGLLNVKPVPDENIVYTFHFYQPFIFCFQGLTPTWGSLEYLQHVPYPSSPEIIEATMDDMLAHVPAWMKEQAEAELRAYGEERWNRDKLAARVQMAVDWAKANGDRKMWVSEWGVYHQAVNPEHRYAFVRDARELFEEHGIGWTIWSYNEAFTVLTPDTRVDDRMLEALGLRPQEA